MGIYSATRSQTEGGVSLKIHKIHVTPQWCKMHWKKFINKPAELMLCRLISESFDIKEIIQTSLQPRIHDAIWNSGF